ncbi:hypothetical protein JOB18_019144 [Solea senegalensis]|uniref:Uncharacterized protein n=1 Tax=Solea senegalensis TaxID=28829 RepID=A0AAV6PZR7_SOLSE|nr:hypothetical protein JOB18_019144 [Solea senegalensis]
MKPSPRHPSPRDVNHLCVCCSWTLSIKTPATFQMERREEQAVVAAAAAAAAAATPGNVDWPSVLTSASSDLRHQRNGVLVWSVRCPAVQHGSVSAEHLGEMSVGCKKCELH